MNLAITCTEVSFAEGWHTGGGKRGRGVGGVSTEGWPKEDGGRGHSFADGGVGHDLWPW